MKTQRIAVLTEEKEENLIMPQHLNQYNNNVSIFFLGTSFTMLVMIYGIVFLGHILLTWATLQ